MDQDQIVRLIGETLLAVPEMDRELNRLRAENAELKGKLVRLVNAVSGKIVHPPARWVGDVPDIGNGNGTAPQL